MKQERQFKLAALLLLSLVALIGCNSNGTIKNPFKKHVVAFHLKVETYSETWHNVRIVFTNDNWDTKEEVMDAFDISGGFMGNDVVHQLRLFDDCEQAASFARRFESYQQCLRFNDSIRVLYDSLLAFRQSHPVGKQQEITDKEQRCEYIIR